MPPVGFGKVFYEIRMYAYDFDAAGEGMLEIALLKWGRTVAGKMDAECYT